MTTGEYEWCTDEARANTDITEVVKLLDCDVLWNMFIIGEFLFSFFIVCILISIEYLFYLKLCAVQYCMDLWHCMDCQQHFLE